MCKLFDKIKNKQNIANNKKKMDNGTDGNFVDAKSLIDTYVSNDFNFKDNFQTREQKARDCEITKLLRHYVTAYSEKVALQKKCRLFLIIFCGVIISLFSLGLLGLLVYFAIFNTPEKLPEIVSLISICVTFVTSILGLTKIITKYCFPENDEEYITKIVETIQKNDLSNKLANMGNFDKTDNSDLTTDKEEFSSKPDENLPETVNK